MVGHIAFFNTKFYVVYVCILDIENLVLTN